MFYLFLENVKCRCCSFSSSGFLLGLVWEPPCIVQEQCHTSLKSISDCKKKFAVEGSGRASGFIFPLLKPKKGNKDCVVLCCKWWQCMPWQYPLGTFKKRISRSDVNALFKFGQLLLPALLHSWEEHFWCWGGICALVCSWGGEERACGEGAGDWHWWRALTALLLLHWQIWGLGCSPNHEAKRGLSPTHRHPREVPVAQVELWPLAGNVPSPVLQER